MSTTCHFSSFSVIQLSERRVHKLGTLQVRNSRGGFCSCSGKRETSMVQFILKAHDAETNFGLSLTYLHLNPGRNWGRQLHDVHCVW